MQGDDVIHEVGALYTACRQELFTYALSITGAPANAEDAVHEAFRKLLSLQDLPVELRPYAFRCVRNAALDLLRYAEREAKRLSDYQILFDEAEPCDAREQAADLLAALPDKEREIVVLKIFSGLTFREVAAVCGQPQGTVAASYWRSLKKLREGVQDAAPLPLKTGEQES